MLYFLPVVRACKTRQCSCAIDTAEGRSASGFNEILAMDCSRSGFYVRLRHNALIAVTSEIAVCKVWPD